MKYAKWETKENIIKNSTKITLNKPIKESGIPLLYESDNAYIYQNKTNTIVIGSQGSGKTQSIILPMITYSNLANESLIINDINGELYQKTASLLEENNYKIKVIDFENPTLGNSWNPLTVPYKLYKTNKDKALDLLENIGYYLFKEKGNQTLDPYWTNSCIDYFTGITMVLFEKAKPEEINISSIYYLANTLTKNALDNYPINSAIYNNLVGTLNAPNETKASIISTFNQKIKKFLNKEELTNMISASDFSLENIFNEKTAIFLVNNMTNSSSNLIPLLINQIISLAEITKFDNKINILLDEFDFLIPIKDFKKIIARSSQLNITFTVVIKSYLDLINMYGKEDADLIKLCFNALIYLISNDITTLEEISTLCGKQDSQEPLISVEELKLLKPFEAVILLPRQNPIKTTLLPDYKFPKEKEYPEKQISKRKTNKIAIYKN